MHILVTRTACRIINIMVVYRVFLVQAKVNFIADGLKPDNDRMKGRAGADISSCCLGACVLPRRVPVFLPIAQSFVVHILVSSMEDDFELVRIILPTTCGNSGV